MLSLFLYHKAKYYFDLYFHKGYIKSWLKAIKDNPQELFNAITDSNKIVDYLEENSIQKEKSISQENDLELEVEYA